MFLFYVYNNGLWDFFVSIKWSDVDDVIIASALDSVASYLDDDNIRFLNIAKFLHDMIHYKQYVSKSLAIYYIDMPG